MKTTTLYNQIVKDIKEASKNSGYATDASENDPRYKAYGVRMAGMREIVKKYKSEFKKLSLEEKVELTDKLIASEMGEEQTVAFTLMGLSIDYFTSENVKSKLEFYISHMFGWSKIDGLAEWFMQILMEKFPKEILEVADEWSRSDNLWKRRASVVLFTRKLAESGKYTDFALELCERLKFDKEDYVQKGLGWCLKDVMRSDQKRVINVVKKMRQEGVSSVVTLYAIRDIKDKGLRAEILASPQPLR